MDDELDLWEELSGRWDVVRGELGRRIGQLTSRLINDTDTASLENVRQIQGEIRAHKELMELPQRMVDTISKREAKKDANVRRRRSRPS